MDRFKFPPVPPASSTDLAPSTITDPQKMSGSILTSESPSTNTSTVTVATTGRVDSDSEVTPEFSVIMLLLRVACRLKAPEEDLTIHAQLIPQARGNTEELSDMSVHLTPLEASAGILVQHGDVIATTYADTIGTVIVTDSTSAINSDTDTPIPLQSQSASKLYRLNNPNPTTISEGSQPHRNPHNLRVLQPGRDLWSALKGNYKWMYALK
jgi:hypothetical protein